MTKIMKLGKNFVECHGSYDADRWLNVALGRNGRINTNKVLLRDVRLHSYVNDETMGALDNYAKHENLSIYITPLENDLFEDLKVSVHKLQRGLDSKEFAIKIQEGREGVVKFFRELYTKVTDAVNEMNKPTV